MNNLKIFFIFISIITVIAIFLFKDKDFSKLNPNLSVKKPVLESSNEKEETIKEVIIKEGDLEKLVVLKDQFKENVFKIDENGINFNSKIKLPFGSIESKSLLIPKVDNNKVKIIIEKLTFQGIDSPSFVKRSIEKAVKSAIDKKVEKGYKLKSIVLKDGELILILKKI